MNLKYLTNGLEYYNNLSSNGLIGLIFVKKDGTLRTMVCSRNRSIIHLCGCTGRPSSNTHNLNVVDLILDQPRYISLDRVLLCEFIGIDKLLINAEETVCKLYSKLDDLASSIEISSVLEANI